MDFTWVHPYEFMLGLISIHFAQCVLFFLEQSFPNKVNRIRQNVWLQLKLVLKSYSIHMRNYHPLTLCTQCYI